MILSEGAPQREQLTPHAAFAKMLKALQPREGFGPTLIIHTIPNQDGAPLGIIFKTEKLKHEERKEGAEPETVYGFQLQRLSHELKAEERESPLAYTTPQIENAATGYQIDLNQLAAPLLYKYAKREGNIPREAMKAFAEMPNATTIIDVHRGKRVYHVIGNQIIRVDVKTEQPFSAENLPSLVKALESQHVKGYLLKDAAVGGDKAVALEAIITPDGITFTATDGSIKGRGTSVSMEETTEKAPKKVEDFGGPHYYPDRIVDWDKPTTRLKDMTAVIRDIAAGSGAIEHRLLDLIIYNAAADVFPRVNSAGDFIPVIDERDQDSRYENAIALILRKDGTIAVPGGFNDLGQKRGDRPESMVKTTVREGMEELEIETIEDLTVIGSRTNPGRDKRWNVSSTSSAGVIKLAELKLDAKGGEGEGGDDAQKVIIVPLEVEGNINPIFQQREPGKLTTVTGETVEFKGMYGDHGDIIADFHTFWQRYGQGEGLNLRETLALKKTIPESWYEHVKPHPVEPEYEQLQNPRYVRRKIDGVEKPSEGEELLAKYTAEELAKDGIRPEEAHDKAKERVTREIGPESVNKTPNIQFVLDNAVRVFRDAGLSVEEAEAKAQSLVLQLVGKDTLPPFPQPAVTIDCVVLEGDSIIAYQYPTGELSLPGSFYSPEKTQVGANIQSTAKEIMDRKWGTDFNTIQYIGQVGGDDVLGRPADPRFPRLSHVLVGRLNAAYNPKPGREFPEGTKIVKIPIWADKENNVLSDQIRNAPWRFDHNKEILQTLFVNSLAVADPRRRFSAEQAFRSPQIKLSHATRDRIFAERRRKFRPYSFDEWVSRIRQPAERRIYRESLRLETKNQVALMGAIVGGREYREEATKIFRELAGKDYEVTMVYNPAIEGREWTPEDADNEARAIETSQAVVDVIKTEYAAVGSMVETPLLALFSVLFEHPISFWVEEPSRSLTESEIRAREKIKIELDLLRGIMPQHIQVFSKGEGYEQVMANAYDRIRAAKEYDYLDEERQRMFVNRKNLLPRVIFSGSSHNPDREQIMASLAAQKPEGWQDAIDTYVAPGSGKEWKVEVDVPNEFNEKFASLINIVDARIDPEGDPLKRPYGSLEDVMMAITRAALCGSYAIIHMPEDPVTKPDGARTDYNRSRILIERQFKQLATRVPWVQQYVRFANSTEEILECTQAIMQNYTPPVWE